MQLKLPTLRINRRANKSQDPRDMMRSGRNSSFTKSFNSPIPSPEPFERQRRSIGNRSKLFRLKRLHKSQVQIVNSFEKKRTYIKDINAQFGTSFTYDKSYGDSFQQIESRAKRFARKQKEQKAATMIQRAWKQKRARLIAQRMLGMYERSAWIIQKIWGHYQTTILAKRKTLDLRIFSATTISRHWRGYKTRLWYKATMREVRMKQNFQYFDSMRTDLHKQCAGIIWKHWKSFKFYRTIRKLDKQRKERMKYLAEIQAAQFASIEAPKPKKTSRNKRRTTKKAENFFIGQRHRSRKRSATEHQAPVSIPQQAFSVPVSQAPTPRPSEPATPIYSRAGSEEQTTNSTPPIIPNPVTLVDPNRPANLRRKSRTIRDFMGLDFTPPAGRNSISILTDQSSGPFASAFSIPEIENDEQQHSSSSSDSND